MCGIAGIIYRNHDTVKKIDIESMLNSIKHRGPDGDGIFIQDEVGFVHTLLKIQDVTEKSVQPYQFNDWVLTYNGEIYNFKKLKLELEKNGYQFDTTGDTEVLIKYIDCYGLDETLKNINGCFAFALYNKKTKETFLVRDRFGIKPLHYYIDDNRFVFSSEIKAILSIPKIAPVLNLDTLLITLSCKLWTDPEKTLFKNIFTLKPGTYIKISNNNIDFHTYYSLKFLNNIKNPEELLEKFGKELESSVKDKLISKVPIAAFLSGGLDSSIVCKLLNDQIKESLNTYTIHYDFDNDLDLNHAELLAKKEKFKQHNILIQEEMYNIENIDKVTYAVEEVLIDKVYIPMYFNYKEAKDDGFTVVISGQGSDEVWLGYIFTWGIFTYLGKESTPEYLIQNYYKKNMIFYGKMNVNVENRIDSALKEYLSKNFTSNEDIINSYGDLSLKTILHDLLMQEDKIAMSNSVESRVPFVDNHKIVELAYRASSVLKTLDGREKYIVRKYAQEKLPDAIVEREKFPFPEPPKIYNNTITRLCKLHWNDIKNSHIISYLIRNECLSDINNFTEIEQWWLITCWRFEKVFKMEVVYE